jgi:NADPH2 dehydrogenase
MGMEDPIPQFTHFVSSIKTAHPNLAYLHAVEPLIGTNVTEGSYLFGESNDFLRHIWGSKPFISAGGYTRESAIARADKHSEELVAFGRQFISNVRSLFFYCFLRTDY